MIQFWREIECHVLCVMVFMIACKYLRLRKLMYKAMRRPSDEKIQGNNYITEIIIIFLYLFEI